MSSPVAHTLLGYACVRRPAASNGLRGLGLLVATLLLANAPDLDFVPGLFEGHARAYHRGWTHSLAATVLAGVAGGAVLRRWLGSFRTGFMVALLLYGSHVVLDTLTPDTRDEAGVPLFWPSTVHVYWPLPGLASMRLALELSVGDSPGHFFRDLLGVAALRVFALEALIFGPLAGIALLLDRRS